MSFSIAEELDNRMSLAGVSKSGCYVSRGVSLFIKIVLLQSQPKF